jgi:hypothetical protein
VALGDTAPHPSRSTGDSAPLPARDQTAAQSMDVDNNDTSQPPLLAAVSSSPADEASKRAQERAELEKLVDSELAKDLGANQTGLYELVGLVTHKGSSADGGHYMSWVRSDAMGQGREPSEDPEAQTWFKFDDDKVSVVPRDKITSLEGGGEDSTAYILLYRTVQL